LSVKEASCLLLNCYTSKEAWVILNDNVEVSLKAGAIFRFQLEDAQIIYKCSPFSGKEEILVNDKIISQSQNFKLNSQHAFSIDNADYELTFESKDLVKGNSECSLKRSGQLLKTYKLKYIKSENKPPLVYRIITLLLCVAIGVGISQKLIPIWVSVVLGILALAIIFITTFKANMENWECEAIDV
jgi:hypothetical protein